MRLVSYIEGPRWREGKNQVPPGYLDCPASDACYLLAQTALSDPGALHGAVRQLLQLRLFLR